MPTPKRFPQVRELLKQYPRTDPFQPLHHPADIHVGSISNQHVNVVAGHFSRKYADLVLHRDLPDQVAHTKRHLPRQHRLAIFRDPHQMHLQIVLRVRSQLVPFHATTLHDPILRLQGEGFPPSPRETLISSPRSLPQNNNPACDLSTPRALPSSSERTASELKHSYHLLFVRPIRGHAGTSDRPTSDRPRTGL